MKGGMSRESLLDCLAFAGAWIDGRKHGRQPAAARGANLKKLPYCVARMIGKQMSLTGLFADVSAGGGKVTRDDRMAHYSDGNDDSNDENNDDGDDCDHDGSEDEFYETELRFCRSG
jgi:hypothetical protein